MYTTEKDLLESIDKDYKYHETREGVSDDFRNGFLAGLNQAKINILNTRKSMLVQDGVQFIEDKDELSSLHDDWIELTELLLGNGFEADDLVNSVDQMELEA